MSLPGHVGEGRGEGQNLGVRRLRDTTISERTINDLKLLRRLSRSDRAAQPALMNRL
jgi:hypothetical protein